jgi:hypothetical protein
MTLQEKFDLSMNLAVLLCFVGVAVFLTCLGSTTFWGDE